VTHEAERRRQRGTAEATLGRRPKGEHEVGDKTRHGRWLLGRAVPAPGPRWGPALPCKHHWVRVGHGVVAICARRADDVTDDPADEATAASKTGRRTASTSSPPGQTNPPAASNEVMIRHETSTMSTGLRPTTTS
jgi:hypothetical protein